MLNWYVKTFELQERHMTKSYIRRTSILSWILFVALLLDPAIIDWIAELYGELWVDLLLVLVLIPLIALFMIGVSPLVHRFWAPDKYLDEWELDVKRRGMAAGYKVLALALLISLVYLGTQMDYLESTKPAVSIERLVSFVFGFLVIAFFAQIQAQLRRIKPIDVDELDDGLRVRRRIGGKIAISVAIFLILFAPPAFKGFSDGFNAAHIEAIEANKLSQEVE